MKKRRDLKGNLSIFDKDSSELCVHKRIHMLNIFKSERRWNMKIKEIPHTESSDEKKM